MLSHENTGVQRRFLWSMLFTGLILVAEVIGGLLSGSLALLSDAAHVFMDLFALGLSLLALRLSLLPPDDQHSFGWHRLEVFAALINGITLLVIAVGIAIEAVQRWGHPVQIKSLEMLIIAVIGLVVNVVVAFTLGGNDHAHGHDHDRVHEAETDLAKAVKLPRKDINLNSAFLHVVGDAISSVGVIAAAILIQVTGLLWIDPLFSILIACIILVSAYRVLRGALHILVEGVPEGLSIHKIQESLGSVPEVSSVHDLHVWSICSGTVSLSAHIVLTTEGETQPKQAMQEVKNMLRDRYQIEHTTIQFEECPCLNGHGGCN
jgi:cobalt-zinc-cadmium efflux system protein